MLGKVVPLTVGETRLAGSLNALPNVVGRTWEYWSQRLVETGRTPPHATRKAKSGPAQRSAAKGKTARRKK
jgi:hypothetical protein